MTQKYFMEEKELSKYVYRIIPKKRLFELFENKENVLVNPALWEDPFENFILKSKIKSPKGNLIEYPFHQNVYGQCWTLNQSSDAMWRIYSSDKHGIRIRTTIWDLLASLHNSVLELGYVTCAIGKVQYWSEKKLKEHGREMFRGAGFKNENIYKSLLIKRPAFRHEKEVRLLHHDVTNEANNNKFRYALDPHSLISQLMLDPRLSLEEANRLKSEISERINFPKTQIKRSLMYRIPESMIIHE